MTDIQSALNSYASQQWTLAQAPFHRMVEEKVMQRVEHKLAKDWAKADAVRSELRRYGFELKENKRDTKVFIPGTNYGWYIITDQEILRKERSNE